MRTGIGVGLGEREFGVRAMGRDGRLWGQNRSSLRRICKSASDLAGGTATTGRYGLPLRNAAVRWGKRVGRPLLIAGVPKTMFY